jgi:antitoxin HicB
MAVSPVMLKYRTHIWPDVQPDGSNVYMAECPDLPGCMSHGATVEEARDNLEDAKNEYLLAIQERGLPIPEPSPAVVGSVTWAIVGTGNTATVGELESSPSDLPDVRIERLGAHTTAILS